jgi:hypothetical protein
MSFYAVAKCMLSSRGSLRRASARDVKRVSLAAASFLATSGRKSRGRGARLVMDSTGKMVICCVAVLHAMYGGTLARWMTPGLGFCRAIKFQGT